MSRYEVRYVGDWISYIYDNETKEAVRIGNEDFVRLLNKQDKQISDLEQQLSLTEKALELACEELYDSDSISICAYCPYDIQDECAGECPQNTKVLEKYFKTKAKEIVESE